jgi:predicted XRE-type DNA-binding protein
MREKDEKHKNVVQELVEQNQLLQERVAALESVEKERGDVAMAKRMDEFEQKLDAIGNSVEQIQFALAAWVQKD